MSFLIKNFNGHAGVCILNRQSSAASPPWVLQGGTFTPLSIGTNVTLEGGFRYHATWNWASSNTATGIILRYFTVVFTTLDSSSFASSPIVSRPYSSTYLSTYGLQTTEAHLVFDAPADCELQFSASYECPSSSLLIWRFPL